MKDEKVRISFDIPVEEHVTLKTECAQARITIKDFLHTLIQQGIKDLQKKQLHKRLKKSIQQSKEGKVKSRGSFAQYADDDI